VPTTSQNLVLPPTVVLTDSEGEQGVEDVEAGVLQVGEQPHQDRPDVAELRPRLDHLRQPELRAL
jgi:hypothetical protein